MRRFFCLSVLAVSMVIALAACNSQDKGNSISSDGVRTTPSPNIKPPGDGVRRMTYVELRDAVEKKTALVVDVRPLISYQQSHIAGSIHIPVEDFPRRIGELPRDKTIVTYCSWPAEQTSARAAHIMKENGIDNVAALLGGTAAWQNAGLPMASAN